MARGTVTGAGYYLLRRRGVDGVYMGARSVPPAGWTVVQRWDREPSPLIVAAARREDEQGRA